MPKNTPLSEMVSALSNINYDAVDPAQLQSVREKIEIFQRVQASGKKNHLGHAARKGDDCKCAD